MRHFILQRIVQLALYATLVRCAVGCGANTDHGPPIGSPTGPIGPVVTEAGSTSTGGRSGDGANTGGNSAATSGGAFDTGAGGSNASGALGNASGGRDPFGIGGSNPSGIGGSNSTDPFGIGGASSAFSGASSF